MWKQMYKHRKQEVEGEELEEENLSSYLIQWFTK